MKTVFQKKEYRTPEFKSVSRDGQNTVFFAGSAPTPGPTPKTAGATLSRIGSW